MMSLLDALPAESHAVLQRLGDAFRADGAELALVGGPIRDLLLERYPILDLDLTTNRHPDAIRVLGQRANPTAIFDIGERFGTIGFVFRVGDRDIVTEITTYRAEQYPDQTRHPVVAFGDSLHDDLSRRDFTINAMALDLLDGILHDPFDGQLDLYQSRIRAVGDPVLRFQEDPLRMLRGARFASQLGFVIDPPTKVAMTDLADEIGRISRERIYQELTRLLCGTWAGHGLNVLLDTGLFERTMPELTPLAEDATAERGMHREKDLWEHTLRVIEKTPPRIAVRWAALLHDAAKPQTRSISPAGEVHFFGHERVGAEVAESLLRRLGADKATTERVRELVFLHLRPAAYDIDWTDSAVRRLVLEAGEAVEDLLALTACDITSANERKVKQSERLMTSLRTRIADLEAETAMAELRSPLDGVELMALFTQPPGRWIADVKDHLRELVIDGALAPGDKTAAAHLAAEYLHL
ncbi:MAG TPA: HD domain-containing protein, partial [Thermomicrobiales bacterium]|nr:HD domain-containing protein [Thermomicrobiales bacterium]